jgi:hypothetical protein
VAYGKWILFALALLLTEPTYGQDFPEVSGTYGHVSWMQTVSDGESLARKLEAVIKTYLPGARDDGRWRVIIEDRTTFLGKGDKVAHEYASGEHMFPPRCHSYTKLRVTECMGPWVREFSQAAKAGTMAHEYGHILCGPKEEDADYCAGYVLRPESFAHPPHLSDFVH